MNLDVSQGPILGVDGSLLQLFQRLKAVDDFAEHGILKVERRLRCIGEEELRPIGVRPGVRHRHSSPHFVLQHILDLVVELA